MAENKAIRPGGPGPGPRGPGHGPRGGFQKPKDLRGTLRKLMRYLGRYKALLVLVVVLRIVSRDDLSLMPKGDKIAKLLRIKW